MSSTPIRSPAQPKAGVVFHGRLPWSRIREKPEKLELEKESAAKLPTRRSFLWVGGVSS